MRWLAAILVGLLVLSVVLPMGQAEDTDTTNLVVWTDSTHEVEATGATVLMEYGAFVLAAANAAQRAALEARFSVEEAMMEISKGAVRFDTRGGDAILPTDLVAQGDEPYRIVQFIGPIHREWRAWLEERVEVLDYVPFNAFVVRGEGAALDSLAASDVVSFVGPYHPAYKLHPWIPASGTWTFDLQLWRGSDVAQVESAIEAIGGTVQLRTAEGFEPYVRIELDAARIPELAGIADIAWIETVFPGDPLDNSQAAWVTQSGAAPGAPTNPSGRSVHAAGLTGAGQVLAVADGGLDSSGGFFLHEMFNDPSHGSYQFGQPNPGHRKVLAYFALTENGVVRGDYTGHYHGVHTAGSVAGDAPEAGQYNTYNLHDGQSFAGALVKMDLASGGSFLVPLDYYNAFQPTYDVGARLHSNSYGYPHDNSYNVRARQNDLYADENPDFLIFRSMGNTAGNTIRPEAVGKNVVGSGATANGQGYENMASFSSRGPTADGRVKPTFVAPGANVMSAGMNGAYASLSGTSMSTPTSAGAAGLVREYFEDGWYSGAPGGFNPSSALVRATLINSAVPIKGDGTTRPGLGGTPFGQLSNLKPNWPNGDMGWGIVRLHNTLAFPGDTHGLFVVDGSTVATGSEVSFTVLVTDPSAGLKITLAWVDAAGTVGANPAIVNDLDLTVSIGGYSVPGNVFAGVPPGFGLGLNTPLNNAVEPVSVPGPPDRRNVEEQVVFPYAPAGEYTITVTGVNVPTGSQAFALVVSGGI